MMIEDWKALKAHIDGLAAMAELSILAHNNDHIRTSEAAFIERKAAELKVKVDSFFSKHKSNLPIETHPFFSSLAISPLSNNPPSHSVAAVTIPFVALGAEVSYLLADTQQSIRLKSERAFAHLRRSIEVNPSIQAEWEAAFSKGETACEKLGATHLLLHGIFAFKVDAQHSRTDLVFREPIDESEVLAISDGLVLTEWKKVKDSKDTDSISKEARDQTKLYQATALAGIELRNYRFIVLVSQTQIKTPSDMEENGIRYRHINLAVQPLSPSVASKISN